jgi:hypothetical protein
MIHKKSKSPYQRQKKTPYRYSDLYQRWREAKLAGREREADGYAREHYSRFVRYGLDQVTAPETKIDKHAGAMAEAVRLMGRAA